METYKFRQPTDNDGILKLEVPLGVRRQEYEVLLVLHRLNEEVDELGWPIGYFEETYGSIPDFEVASSDTLPPDVRDEIE